MYFNNCRLSVSSPFSYHHHIALIITKNHFGPVFDSTIAFSPPHQCSAPVSSHCSTRRATQDSTAFGAAPSTVHPNTVYQNHAFKPTTHRAPNWSPKLTMSRMAGLHIPHGWVVLVIVDCGLFGGALATPLQTRRLQIAYGLSVWGFNVLYTMWMMRCFDRLIERIMNPIRARVARARLRRDP
ncbi:hypothetical protein BU26DRAFT_559249 [Trematosphaeria pertusa]|uniref:Uncharacterized protein n=1 Tax=Trematosphaeria pertusa TaxID=390896 RepID=A0A6A6IVY5_9PLEO|nr:uncharacterized protein BU26DRAFT_559249 [Trematosphaeria pertusa]KAF2254574.1 hypothetical protein BU26DRAFT_559249 [Trematosphaeria pertusa]